MYGKILSLKDEFIIKYFILTTRVDLNIIDEYKKLLETGTNPKEIKMKLAFELVKFYYSEKDAFSAEEYFINTFGKKETPTDIPTIKPTQYDILTVLVESKISPSKSEARRNIEQKGVRVNNIDVSDDKLIVKSGDIIQKGKRFFIKII